MSSVLRRLGARVIFVEVLCVLFISGTSRAQLRLNAEPVSPGVSPAMAWQPVSALRYVSALTSPAPALGAGTAFLKDSAAQQWLINNRPEQYPVLARNALDMADWEEVLTSYDDPRLLREAILAREDDTFGKNPAALLDLVDRTPGLAAKRQLFETAVLDWSVISAETRGILIANDIPEERWTRLTLKERYEIARKILPALAQRLITVTPGHPRYADQQKAALNRMIGVLTILEINQRNEVIARAQRLKQELRRAGKAAASAADKTAAALVKNARTAGDIDAAEEFPGRTSESLDALSPKEMGILTKRLLPALVQATAGTTLSDQALSSLNGEVRFGISSAQREMMSYEYGSHVINLATESLSRLLEALGHSPRDLLTDDEALADIAVIYSSVFVHEMTHHRQSLWGRSRFPKKIAGSDQVFAYGYNQAWETEAFKAAAAFLKQKRAADPSFAAREARLRRIPLIDRYFAEEENAKDLAEMPRFRQYYTAVPTLSRSARQIIALGIENDEKNARSAKLIDVELARRSRLARLERLALEKNGIAFEALRGGANLKKTSTSGLRRLRDELRGQAQIMLKAANDLIERTRTELEKL